MRILSGVQSSGKVHLGNYFGAIRQFIELQEPGGRAQLAGTARPQALLPERWEALYFIANLHALTTVRDAAKMRELTRDVALDFLALGLDPKKAILFRQSDIPEVIELFWHLAVVTPMGLLERAHSYKDKVAKGIAPDAGLFVYPVLMAADILLYGSDLVPVGKDQVQHLEMTRDIAVKFNLAFCPGYDPKKDPDAGILKLPKPFMKDETAVVPGVDGQKMSKSYGNTIDLFGDEAATRKRIMGIKTDSLAVDAPKDKSTTLYALLKLVAKDMSEIDRTFEQGGKGYGHYKQELADSFFAYFKTARERRKELEKDPAYIETVLEDGAARARAIAKPIIDSVRKATGMTA